MLIAASLLCLFAGAIYAQQSGVAALSLWFKESKSREIYRPVEGELTTLFREADSESLPSSVLIDRLNLGAARRLRPALLVAGMQEELSRLQAAAGIIERAERSLDGRRLLASLDRKDLFNAISIYLSGGLTAHLIEEFLTDSSRSGRSADRVLRACAVLLTVDRVGHFTDEELLDFGTALVGSAVAPSSYPAVGSFLVRASATGRGGSGMLRSASQILRQGGGLPQMELELGRRR